MNQVVQFLQLTKWLKKKSNKATSSNNAHVAKSNGRLKAKLWWMCFATANHAVAFAVWVLLTFLPSSLLKFQSPKAKNSSAKEQPPLEKSRELPAKNAIQTCGSTQPEQTSELSSQSGSRLKMAKVHCYPPTSCPKFTSTTKTESWTGVMPVPSMPRSLLTTSSTMTAPPKNEHFTDLIEWILR